MGLNLLALVTHTCCAIFCAVLLPPLPVSLCTAVLPEKFPGCGALGFAAGVSSPQLVLYRYTSHPSDLRCASEGEKTPKPKLLGVASLSGVQNIFLGNMRKKCMENISVAH